VRLIFDKHNGALAGTNAVARMFLKQGIINIEKAKIDEDKLMELVLEAGAEDVVTSEEGYEVTTTFQAFEKVRQALVAAKVEMVHAEVMMIPQQTVAVSGDVAEKIQKIVEGVLRMPWPFLSLRGGAGRMPALRPTRASAGLGSYFSTACLVSRTKWLRW
jgi:transcriptional/translational regulatory protein YebC/TACO1